MRILIASCLAVGALAGAAFAQQGEIFIPGADNNNTLIQNQAPAPQNQLAACLANASAANCDGVNLDPEGLSMESFSGGPQLTYETLVLDLNAGTVKTSDAPPPAQTDYTAPVKHSVALPSIAVTIEFDYNSAYVRADQRGKLDTLTAALMDPSLRSTAFAVIGHTDAVGSDYYNCDLSRRRADEVTRELDRRYVPTRLYPVGFGEKVLKNVYDPRAAENRRVTFLRLPDDVAAVLQTAEAVCPRY